MKYNTEDLDKINRNVILYGTSLANQKKKLESVADNLESSWKSGDAQKAITALREAATKIGIVSKSVEEYMPVCKAIMNAAEKVGGGR